jgi:Mce-associated membrane protein
MDLEPPMTNPEEPAAEIPAGSPAASPTASRSGLRPTPAQTATALVLVLLVAALVITQVQLSNQHSSNADRTTAVAAAKGYAADVATYDYRHLQADFAKVEQESTPAFRRTFVKSSGGLSKVLVQYHATAKAKVLTAGLVSLTASEAVVILFVNQTVSNTAQKGPSTDDSRVQITLVHSGGRWLLDRLKLL